MKNPHDMCKLNAGETPEKKLIGVRFFFPNVSVNDNSFFLIHLILNGDYIYPCFVASLLSKVKLPKLVSRTNTCILYLLNTNSTEYKVYFIIDKKIIYIFVFIKRSQLYPIPQLFIFFRISVI